LRSFIENGELDRLCEVATPYSIYATVEHGKELGRTIGIPTINQRIPSDKITPARGVYITECEIGEDVYPSVTNVGVRPSVDTDGAENMETHIIGFNGNLYGSGVRVNFYKKIRDEKKFSSIEELKAEITSNISLAIEFFK
jgi:riboflavin kinase/FMN adenylyltransferase